VRIIQWARRADEASGTRDEEHPVRNPAEAFNGQKEVVRRQLADAVRAYQRLARIELDAMTSENAAEVYQEFVAIEAMFERVGGVLDAVRLALHRAGEHMIARLEQVGFAGERAPTVTDAIEEDDVPLVEDAK
jgi:hypothetical protein